MTAPNRPPLYGWIYRLRAPGRSLYGWIACVIAAGVGYLLLFAILPDPYFGDRRSRWEFAAGDGQFVVAAIFAFALSAVYVLAFAARSRASTGLRILAALMAVVTLPSLVLAFLILGTGH